jgi:hypothetical protein
VALGVILLITVATLAALWLALAPRLRFLVGRHEFAVAVLLPTIAMFSPHYLFFALAAGGLVAMAPAFGPTGRPSEMEHRLRLLMFCLLLLPPLQYTMMLSSFTIAQLQSGVILCAGVAVAIMISGLATPRSRLAGWDLTFAAMMAAQLFMDARSEDLAFTLRMVVQIGLNMGLPYFIVSRAFASVREPAWLLLALLFGTCVIASIAIIESFRHWLLYEAMISHAGADAETVSGYTKMRGGMLRARATFPESTGLSLYLGVALTLLFGLRKQLGSARLLWVMASLLAVGLMVTFARVGYIAVGIGLVACLVYERRYRSLSKVLLVMPIIALALVAMAGSVPFIAASIGTSSDAEGSVDYRSMLIDAGLAIVRDHPIAGLRMVDLLNRLEPLRQGEGIVDLVNQPLTILMRGGLVFGFLYGLMTFRVISALYRRRRLATDPATRACASAFFGALVGLLMALMTTSFGRNEFTFILLLAAGAGIVARRVPVRAVQPKATANSVLPIQPAAAPATAVPSMINS